jgi:CRP/FNR family transcriptional regulator, cyclic AMP receptor protein
MQSNGALQLGQNSSKGEWIEGDGADGLAKRDSIELEAGSLPVFFPKGGLFFLEGQSATGIFLLRFGRAKESMVSTSGRIAIVRVICPGTILGLSAVLTGAPHESTVETLEPSHADFLAKPLFLHLLKTSSRLGKVVASQLSRDCKEAYASVRCFALSITASGRLARLVLRWAEHPLANQDKNAAKVRIRVVLTHEEIGQSMGTTRETISRTLREFQEKRWITMQGSVWTITDEDAIRRVAAL